MSPIIIPAGVFHGFSYIPDHVTYLSVRPDPNKVLEAGYVNPAVRHYTELKKLTRSQAR